MNRERSKTLIEIAILANGMEEFSKESLMEALTMMANDDDVELRNCILLAIAEQHSGTQEEGNRIADSVFCAVKELFA